MNILSYLVEKVGVAIMGSNCMDILVV